MFEKLKKAYREELKVPARKFFTYAIVSVIFTLLLIILLNLLYPDYFSFIIFRILFYSVPIYVLIIIILYPLIRWERRGKLIDRDMHLFITRMGVLSVAEVARKEMFDILARMKEYRTLADEIKKIYVLVSGWNISLEKACRLVAETTPSELLADFLNRLAYAVESGETTEVFFKNEQIVVMNQYKTKYESAMRLTEAMKEVFIALVTAALFVIVIVSLIPLLTGEDASLLMGIAVLLFVFIEFAFLYLLYSIVPGELIWHTMKIKTDVHRSIERKLVFGSILSILVLMLLLVLTLKPPLPIFVALCVSPLLIPGLYVNAQEMKIKRRDDFFPAFIRSLGTIAEAKTRDMAICLRRLRTHDFGPLTKNIEDQYRRISMRIKRDEAWELFAAETCSELISKFNEMFVEGMKTGGNPKKISQIISDNFITILGLRKMKYESSSSLTGVLYGIMVACSVILYMSLYLVNAFYNLFSKILTPETIEALHGYEYILLLQPKTFDFFVLACLTLAIIIVHAFVSAWITRIISGGHVVGALTHFVGLIWVGGIVAIIVCETMKYLIGGLIGV